LYDLLVAKRNAANSEDNPETISWQALGNETENALGQRIDNPRAFKIQFEADPELDKICSYGPEGVKLKTDAEEMPATGGNTGKNTVSKMAKSATARRQG
jgi:hypothetical protein